MIGAVVIAVIGMLFFGLSPQIAGAMILGQLIYELSRNKEAKCENQCTSQKYQKKV